jgi:hypothetical protein
MASESVPQTLTAALAVSDEEERLAAVTAYIRRGEQRLALARVERVELVRQLRGRVPVPVTWRRIAALTGASESYWRREVQG